LKGNVLLGSAIPWNGKGLHVLSARTLDDVAASLGLTRVQLTYWAFLTDSNTLYTEFQLPKRSGGSRAIRAPAQALKSIQRKLLALLDTLYSPRPCVHGFVKKQSIVSNAAPHSNKRHVLNVDIEDFFPSINFGRVRGALIARPFNLPPDVSTVIARLCCFNNSLPQGAPTSPIIANIVCMRLDGELSRLARTNGCKYTRYADDLTFSTHKRDFPPTLGNSINPPYGTEAVVGPTLRSVIVANGFRVNEKKVRLFGRRVSQRVTGLTVNEKPNVQRRFIRQIRGMIHAWEKFGLQAAETEHLAKYFRRYRSPVRKPPKFDSILRGKLLYLAMVRGPSDPTFVSFAKRCRAKDPLMFKGILDLEDTIDRNVWVLECPNAHTQGTGFFLANVGFVTCFHVLGTDTEAFHPSNPSKKYKTEILKFDEHLDLAALNIIGCPQQNGLLRSPNQPSQYDKVMVSGYPNYGSSDSITKSWGSVSTLKVRQGVTYIVPTTAIAKGMSGGPLVDDRYRVAGVASRGVNDLKEGAEAEPDKFGAIAIKHIDVL
jgi:RNA-directed DNA polymerase